MRPRFAAPGDPRQPSERTHPDSLDFLADTPVKILTRYMLAELTGPTAIALGLYTFLMLMNWVW